MSIKFSKKDKTSLAINVEHDFSLLIIKEEEHWFNWKGKEGNGVVQKLCVVAEFHRKDSPVAVGDLRYVV